MDNQTTKSGHSGNGSNRRIIDMHCHVFPESIAQKAVDFLQNYYGLHWQGSGLADDLKSACIEAGIFKCVIFSSATKPEQVPAVNNYISSLVKKDPELFCGLGTIHPEFPDWEKELDRIVSLGLKGLKIHPDFQQLDIDDPRMLDIYKSARERNLLHLFHTGDKTSDHSSPFRLANVMNKYPDLKVIAAHLGGYCRWDDAMKCLIGSDIYLDCSSAIPFAGREKSRQLILMHGTDKVLFASDYPAMRPDESLRQLASLDLSKEDMDKICFYNAEKLLQL